MTQHPDENLPAALTPRTHTPRTGWLTMNQASKKLGVPTDLIRALIRSRRIEGIKTTGSKGGTVWMIPKTEVQRLAEEMGNQ